MAACSQASPSIREQLKVEARSQATFAALAPPGAAVRSRGLRLDDSMSGRAMKLLAGNSNRRLSQSIARVLDTPLTRANLRRFADNEVFVVIEENVRGEDVFVLQSTSFPANDNLMELLICIDALSRASARRITAVMPYFGYARQDRKVGGRTPISAKLVANLITRAGADRVLTMDMHSGQIQGFFDIPTDNLLATPLMASDVRLRERNVSELMIVSPDVGGVVRARSLAERLDADLAVVDKKRTAPGVSQVMNIIGDVKGRRCVLFDDIADSAGTLCNAAEALVEAGAASVSAYVTHGVLSGGAVERVASSVLTELVITDSIEATEEVLACAKIRHVTCANLIGEAIRRIANEESVSKLFD
jgi:ribose-phosphate pyrophosphokinase